MKTENVIKVRHTLEFLLEELNDAHIDAIDDKNEFASIVFSDLIDQATLIRRKMHRVMIAIGEKGY